jgi:integrase
LVFSQPIGRPVDPRADWQAWKALLHDAGVRDPRLHDARHTAATLLLTQGVPARVAMQILGHSQIRLTHLLVRRAGARHRGGAARRQRPLGTN